MSPTRIVDLENMLSECSSGARVRMFELPSRIFGEFLATRLKHMNPDGNIAWETGSMALRHP